MKWIISAVLASAIVASPLRAQQEPEDKEKPKQEEPKPKQEEPKPKQEEPKQQPPSQEKEKSKTNSEKQQPEPSKQQKADEKQQQKEPKDAQKQSKESEKQNRDAEKAPKDNHQPPSGSQQTDRGRPSAEESHGQGQRIPEQKFQASFGRGHHFRVRHLDDRHRFQYGGYWFEVAQPWPTGWSYDDDCYIGDDGGTYYLVDLIHPDIRVLVIVVEA